MAQNLTDLRKDVYDYVYAMLGGGMVDVELDPIHYQTSLDTALSRYRQRSDNSVEESYAFLTLQPDQNEYTLDNNIMEVRQAYRRSIGSRPTSNAVGGPLFTQSHVATSLVNQTFFINYNLSSVTGIVIKVNNLEVSNFSTDYTARTITFTSPLNAGDVVGIELYSSSVNGGGSLFEPFNLAYTNAYLLASSNTGGLATYDFFSQYQELVGRMFGSFIEFIWNNTTKKLTILQRPRTNEEVMLYCYNYRPDFELLQDYQASQWIKDYTLAKCKMMLGEARSKFATIAGPQGGSALNGDALKAEGQAELEKLEAEVSLQIAGGVGYGFTIG